MILFIILAFTALLLMVASIALLSAGGATFIVILSDVIVCAFLIIWIMKRLLSHDSVEDAKSKPQADNMPNTESK